MEGMFKREQKWGGKMKKKERVLVQRDRVAVMSKGKCTGERINVP